jgi:CDP-diglyceride synthetase
MIDNLKTRIIVAAVLIPSAVVLLSLGRWPLAVALAALGVLGTWEVFGLAEPQGIKPLREFGYAAAAAIPLATYAAIGRDPGWAEVALYVAVLAPSHA